MNMLSDVAEFVVQGWTPCMGKFSNPRIGGSACETRCRGRERMDTKSILPNYPP